MDERQKKYRVIITRPALERYLEILYYVYEYYTQYRAEQISDELMNTPAKLENFPFRGAIEENLSHRREKFRYILYEPANNTTIKIIYFVEEQGKTVYVTDFFPTEMNQLKIKHRS